MQPSITAASESDVQKLSTWKTAILHKTTEHRGRGQHSSFLFWRYWVKISARGPAILVVIASSRRLQANAGTVPTT
jgi:hypothetical protein